MDRTGVLRRWKHRLGDDGGLLLCRRFDIARRVVKNDLKGTKFADYSRIYDERAEPAAAAPKSRPQGAEMLVPPWVMCQGLDQHDTKWRSGKAASYLAKWVAWYQNFPTEARAAYGVAFREPKGWSGFYESVSRPTKPAASGRGRKRGG